MIKPLGLEQKCNEPVQCSCLMELLTGLSLVVADTSVLRRYRGLWLDDARSTSRAWSHYWRAWHLWALAIALLTSSPDRTWHWTDETLTQTGLGVSECCRGGHRGIMDRLSSVSQLMPGYWPRIWMGRFNFVKCMTRLQRNLTANVWRFYFVIAWRPFPCRD